MCVCVCVCVCVFRGAWGVGACNGDNFGMGVRASISKPTPFTWPLRKTLTHSDRSEYVMLTDSYTAR